jgi:5-(carboxyamino)imidazole ribonucleotide synthase
LKTAGGGYDGKGQAVVRSTDELRAAWNELKSQPCTLERLVDLDCEVSVIVARDVFGAVVTYGPILNQHANHILDISSCPANINSKLEHQAREMAREIATQFDLTGLICVEFFVTRTGEILVNEIAPRPHNSGHLTIEAFSCSQFEQQLRTVCGLPVAPATQTRPAAMVNLLGDVWGNGEPNWKNLADVPSCYLHLYDKSDPRPGRKMGHITVCADTLSTAIENAVASRKKGTGVFS